MSEVKYPHNKSRPPMSPAIRRGSANLIIPDEDTAKYILDPDGDFERPYLAIPGGRAFVWPLGVEGFEIQDMAELGRHKYLGEIELDVDVTHKAETEITLSGIFPGWTSTDNMAALRQIFFADTPERGKILHLPGVLPNLQYVVCERETFSHTRDERTQDIEYQFSVVKVGTGKPSPSTLPPGSTTGNSGRGTRKFRSTGQVNTLRKIASRVFRNSQRWTQLYAVRQNAAWFDKRNISSHKAPDYRLPLGTIIYY